MSSWDRMKQAAKEAVEDPKEKQQRENEVTQAVTSVDGAWQYEVTEVREGLAGGAPSQKLERLLNERGAAGWRYKALVGGDVVGAFGGRKDGWMLVLERRKP